MLQIQAVEINVNVVFRSIVCSALIVPYIYHCKNGSNCNKPQLFESLVGVTSVV